MAEEPTKGEPHAQIDGVEGFDGCYDDRYRMQTPPEEDLDELRKFFKGNELCGIPPPEKVYLALKGFGDDEAEEIADILNPLTKHYEGVCIASSTVKELYLNDNQITAKGESPLLENCFCHMAFESHNT